MLECKDTLCKLIEELLWWKYTLNKMEVDDLVIVIDDQPCENKQNMKKEEVPMYIISDEEWLFGLPEKERNWYERNLMSCEEIETRTIVCTACFKQTNHKNFGE